MTYQNLTVLEEERVFTVQINRPKHMNALSYEVLQEIEDVLDYVETNDNIRVVIITGNQKFFSAGADINQLKQLSNAFSAYEFSRRFHKTFSRIELLKKPVIAAIEGYALGGGLELALACDFRIAAEDARLGVPEVSLCALPAGGGTVKLARLVGILKAKELLLLGEQITGREAEKIGLVNIAVSREKVMSKAKEISQKLCEKPAKAIEQIKVLVQSSVDMDLAGALLMESKTLGLLTTSDDFKEAIRAFFEKRKPVFQGR
jgi:enoyl-CoA hydratase